MSDEDDEYFLPLQDQRVFGAGVKRKRVPFIPASSGMQKKQGSPRQKIALGDRYLSIVLPHHQDSEGAQAEPGSRSQTQEGEAEVSPDQNTCAICNLPIDDSKSPDVTTTGHHETSIAHQVSLPHSNPPSHLDRSHVGLKYLSSYGWDPDSRNGLGATGTGIRVPIKSKVKNNTVGLGVEQTESKSQPQKKKKPDSADQGKTLKASQRRKLELEEKARDDMLRQQFYGKDLEQYLGPSS